MMIKQTLIALAIIIGIGGFLVSPVALADKCAGVETSIVDCPSSGDGVCPDGSIIKGVDIVKGVKCNDKAKSTPKVAVKDAGIWGLLMLVLNIMTAGIAVVAVGGVVYGSILYTTAGGSLDQVKKGREVIANTALGILLYALMYAFMNFIIPGGLFKP